jgi:ABC-type nitrate/sulfonate/bicarbonate transport system substrate-binding protein
MADLSRREILSAGAAALALAAAPRLAAAPLAGIEKPQLKVGFAVDGTSFCIPYVAAARFWKEEGLAVEDSVFRGDSEVAQALAGDSIDISLQSFDGAINLANAGQSTRAFYAGFYQADFAWMVKPEITDWAALKGGSLGISTLGSITDALTRHALRRHDLLPERDVQLIQAGGSATGFQALKSGRLTGCILNAPFKWIAADAGFRQLGTMTEEIAPQWPKHAIVAKQSFLDKHPQTVKAFLRAHVAACRLAKADRAFTVQVLIDRLKYERRYAERAYDEVVPAMNERGTLPEAAMDVFWQIKMADGSVKERWPVSRLLDDRFIKSFDEWAPK